MSELYAIQQSLESIDSTIDNELSHQLGIKTFVKTISSQLTAQQGTLNNMYAALLTTGDPILIALDDSCYRLSCHHPYRPPLVTPTPARQTLTCINQMLCADAQMLCADALESSCSEVAAWVAGAIPGLLAGSEDLDRARAYFGFLALCRGRVFAAVFGDA